VFRHALGRVRQEVEVLNAEIKRFSEEFPEDSAVRIAAFHILGSVIGRPDYVALRLTPVDPAGLEEHGQGDV